MNGNQFSRPPDGSPRNPPWIALLLPGLIAAMFLLNSREYFFALGGANHPFLPPLILGAVSCALILPLVIRLVRVRAARSQRLHNNQCVECGFDLRASIDRCPECGTPFDTSRVNKPHPDEITPLPKIDRRAKGSSPIAAAKPMPHDHPQADGRS